MVHFRVVGILTTSEIPLNTEWEKQHISTVAFWPCSVLYYVSIKNPFCFILFSYVVYEWLTADYYLWYNSSNVLQMAESISVQDTESHSLLICLMFWQLTVAFVKEGTITYQEKEQYGGSTKGKETPAVSRPVHGLFCHLSLFSAAWANFSNGYDALPSGMAVLQFSACSPAVCQDNVCAAACRGCKGECRAQYLWILHSHVMPLNMTVFQIRISCYKRFPEPEFGEMEEAWLHTLHHPSTTAYSAAFHATRILDLKALAKAHPFATKSQ